MILYSNLSCFSLVFVFVLLHLSYFFLFYLVTFFFINLLPLKGDSISFIRGAPLLSCSYLNCIFELRIIICFNTILIIYFALM